MKKNEFFISEEKVKFYFSMESYNKTNEIMISLPYVTHLLLNYRWHLFHCNNLFQNCI